MGTREDAGVGKVILLPTRKHAKPKNRLITRETTIRPFRFTTVAEGQLLTERRPQRNPKRTPPTPERANKSSHSFLTAEDGIDGGINVLDGPSHLVHSPSNQLKRNDLLHNKASGDLVQDLKKKPKHFHNVEQLFLSEPKLLCETDSYHSSKSSGQKSKITHAKPDIEHAVLKSAEANVPKHTPVTDSAGRQNSKQISVSSGSKYTTEERQYMENNHNLLKSSQPKNMSIPLPRGRHSSALLAPIFLTKHLETRMSRSSNRSEKASGSEARLKSFSAGKENLSKNLGGSQDIPSKLTTSSRGQTSSSVEATNGHCKRMLSFENSVHIPSNVDNLASHELRNEKDEIGANHVHSILNSVAESQSTHKRSHQKRSVEHLQSNIDETADGIPTAYENSQLSRSDTASDTHARGRNYSVKSIHQPSPLVLQNASRSEPSTSHSNHTNQANNPQHSNGHLHLNNSDDADEQSLSPSRKLYHDSDNISSALYSMRADSTVHNNSVFKKKRKVNNSRVNRHPPTKRGQDSANDMLKVRVWSGSKKRVNADVFDLDFVLITLDKVMDEFRKGLPNDERKIIDDFHGVLIHEITQLIPSFKKYRTDYMKFLKVGRKFRKLRTQFYEELMKCSAVG